MVEIWECQKYFHLRNIFMSGIFSCQEYLYGGNMRVSEIFPYQEQFHVRNVFMTGIFSWWKYEFVRNKIFRGLLSIKCTAMFCQLGMRISLDYKTTILCYIEKWDLGMTTGDGTRCWRIKKLEAIRNRSVVWKGQEWLVGIWTFWTTIRAKKITARYFWKI